MKTNTATQIQAYFENSLNPIEKQQLESQIAEDPTTKTLFEEYQVLYQDLEQVSWEKPSTELKNNFNHWLLDQQEVQLKQKAKSLSVAFPWRSAAAIGVILIGACLGVVLMKNQQQQTEIAFLAKEMQKTQQLLTLSMLEQPSASQRIKAMNEVGQQLQSVDPQITQSLIERLLNDENINVRSAASEALGQFPASQQVIQSLITALGQEEEPLVQISIIEALVQLKAGQAIPKLEDLLQQNKIIPVVKDQAAKGIDILI